MVRIMGNCIGSPSTGGSDSSSAGEFKRADIPVMRRGTNGTFSAINVKGYTQQISGYDVNIQKGNGEYKANIYGVIASPSYNTLREAKEKIPQYISKFLQSEQNKANVEKARRVLEEVRRRGGTVSSDEYRKISRQMNI